MTKEEIQNEIECIAQQGATDGCNLAYIEREAEKLAERIVKLFTTPVVRVSVCPICQIEHNGDHGWCNDCINRYDSLKDK